MNPQLAHAPHNILATNRMQLYKFASIKLHMYARMRVEGMCVIKVSIKGVINGAIKQRQSRK